MAWKRLAQERLRKFYRQFAAVLILEARWVGKTTLAKQTFPGLSYCDLEEPRWRDWFLEDSSFEHQKNSS
jgi:hypothetical protein